jgi:Protein of unknown function (DUF2800)
LEKPLRKPSFAPSARNRWKNCPGSVHKVIFYPQKPLDKAALEGINDHKLLEVCLANRCTVDDAPKHYCFSFELTDDRKERIQVALDYILPKIGPKTIIQVEQWVPFKYLNKEFAAYIKGKTDVVLIDEDRGEIEIIDYKGGRFKVNVEDNEQIELYEMGVTMQLYVENKELFHKIHTVVNTIIQPQRRDYGELPVYAIEKKLKDVLTKPKVASLVEDIKRGLDPSSPLRSGDWCTFCDHKVNCSEIKKDVADKLHVDEKDIVKQLVTSTDDKAVTALSDNELFDLYKASSLIKSYLKAVEEEVLARRMAGKLEDVLDLTTSSTNRTIPDKDAFAAYCLENGFTREEIYKSTLITPSQFEKLTRRDEDGNLVKIDKQMLKYVSDTFFERPEGEAKVVLKQKDDTFDNLF